MGRVSRLARNCPRVYLPVIASRVYRLLPRESERDRENQREKMWRSVAARRACLNIRTGGPKFHSVQNPLSSPQVPHYQTLFSAHLRFISPNKIPFHQNPRFPLTIHVTLLMKMLLDPKLLPPFSDQMETLGKTLLLLHQNQIMNRLQRWLSTKVALII